MRVGPQLEATRHLLGELTLTLARQSRHHFPKQGRCPTTSLGCRRGKPLLALSSKPTKFLADRHKQSVCHVSRHDSNKDLAPIKTGCAGRLSEHAPAWRRIRELHIERYGRSLGGGQAGWGRRPVAETSRGASFGWR
jgi:hypothetical protein